MSEGGESYDFTYAARATLDQEAYADTLELGEPLSASEVRARLHELRRRGDHLNAD